MLVPSTPRWAMSVSAIWRILRRVAEPSPGAAPLDPPEPDAVATPDSALWESIVMFMSFSAH
jgi:hypothetical protein